jgi:hypothetical protein
VSEYSEFAGFDHKALWFGPKQATTCELKDNFSDTLLDMFVEIPLMILFLIFGTWQIFLCTKRKKP